MYTYITLLFFIFIHVIVDNYLLLKTLCLCFQHLFLFSKYAKNVQHGFTSLSGENFHEGLPADFQCASGSTRTCLGSILISWTSPIWQQLRE